jgi:putative phosphoesterase
MKLGILSDSHGRTHLVRQALHLLDTAGAEAIIHCGDVGGLDVLDELAGRQCWFVWGNTDQPHSSWRHSLEALGLPWPTAPLQLTLDGRRIGVYHGHERAFRDALRDARYDYLLHGHTHQRDDYREGTMRVINPGALHRVSVRTVALLDLATDDLRFLELDSA